MKSFAIALLTVVSLSTASEWDAFKVTYGVPGSGLGYYDMPWTVQEATAQGQWEKVDEDRKLNVNVYSQHGDPRLMLLFDKRDNIAGLRLSFLKADVATKAKSAGIPFEFDYEHIPLYEKGNYYNQEVYYATMMFVHPKVLASGGRRSLNRNRDSAAEGIFYRKNGKWFEMSRDECRTSNDFDEGNCTPGMGQHYIYKLLEQKECYNRQPFFGLYDQGRLIGFGIQGYGTYSKPKNTKSKFYYDEFPEGARVVIASNAPSCIGEYIRNYGITMMHTYFKKNASQLNCTTESWRATHCKSQG